MVLKLATMVKKGVKILLHQTPSTKKVRYVTGTGSPGRAGACPAGFLTWLAYQMVFSGFLWALHVLLLFHSLLPGNSTILRKPGSVCFANSGIHHPYGNSVKD